MPRDQAWLLRERFNKIWPALVIGLGLIATMVWVAVLGWLVLHAIQLVL